MHQLTDKALLIADDDQEAFRLLYERYWDALYVKALHRTGNDADAQDVVQEVFISLWRNKKNIQSKDSLSAYLFTALKYCIIKRVYRQAQKGIVVPLSVEDLEKTDLTAEELLHYKELQSAIAAEVAGLPERMREVYRLSRTENLSIKEIAQRLNLSEQTVKNTLSSTLKRLREKLARYACWLPFFI
ncbi:RNA polymerase sigma factor [Niastella vici]|nr:RNA polymerase sigma-70 factor [Niastella vici]